MKKRNIIALASILPVIALAGFAPRLNTTIDSSAQMTPAPLSMAQAADQDFGFDFTNLQTSFNTNTDSCVFYYTDECYTNWQVSVTGVVEDADTVVISVDPAHSNTNTAEAGFFPWRLEVQDSAGTIIAKGYGSLTIEKSPVAAGTPALVTTTNINTADYTVSGQWPVSSIPDLSGTYVTNRYTDAEAVAAGTAAGFVTTAVPVVVSGGLLTSSTVNNTNTVGLTTQAVVDAVAPTYALISEPVATGHIAQASAAHAASAITVTPVGTIAAMDAQAAIEELDTEKFPYSGGTITGDTTVSNSASVLTLFHIGGGGTNDVGRFRIAAGNTNNYHTLGDSNGNLRMNSRSGIFDHFDNDLIDIRSITYSSGDPATTGHVSTGSADIASTDKTISPKGAYDIVVAYGGSGGTATIGPAILPNSTTQGDLPVWPILDGSGNAQNVFVWDGVSNTVEYATPQAYNLGVGSFDVTIKAIAFVTNAAYTCFTNRLNVHFGASVPASPTFSGAFTDLTGVTIDTAPTSGVLTATGTVTTTTAGLYSMGVDLESTGSDGAVLVRWYSIGLVEQ